MPGVLRIVDRHDLVELGRGIGIDGDRRRRRHAIGTAAHVGNDDLVAEPVHLGERRRRAQFRLREMRMSVWCAYMAETAGNCQRRRALERQATT